MITQSDVTEAKKKAVGGARKRCRKGKSCSAACIAGMKVCLVSIPSVINAAISKATSLITRSKVKEEVMPVPKGTYKVRSEEPKRKLISSGGRLERRFRGKDWGIGVRVELKDRARDMEKPPKDIKKATKDTVKSHVNFARRLNDNLPKGVRTFLINGIVAMTAITESGDKVLVQYSPKIGFHFNVNGSNDVGTVKTRRAQIQVTSKVKEIYDATVRSLPVGTIMRTRAHTEDGGGEKRTSIYRRLGFSDPWRVGDDMYGKVGPGNTVSPSDARSWMDQRTSPDSLYFAEESKGKVKGTLADWYQIIFGKELVWYGSGSSSPEG